MATRKCASIADELIQKSREAALAAVQVFNNPQISFKSEIFIVIMCVAWTYLLHAYYRKNKIEYRYYKIVGNRKKFDKTIHKAYKHWNLERCLNTDESPIDKDSSNNLRFLIKIRHEIEHQMTNKIDNYLTAKFQACCLNFNFYIKKLFGEKYGIDKHLMFSLQFSSMEQDQLEILDKFNDLPHNIQRFIEGFEGQLSEAEYNSPQFAYRILFVAKTANNKNQADRVIEFVKPDSPLAQHMNTEYALIKEKEKPKYLPKKIVEIMNEKGYSKFLMYHHTQLWKNLNAKDPSKGYGVDVENKWYWYENWLNIVKDHCDNNRESYI